MESMTGFGKANKTDKTGNSFDIEIFSVNRKNLDIKIKLPPELLTFENNIRTKIKQEFSRGMVNLKVISSYTSFDTTDVNINSSVISKIIKNCKTIQKEMLLKQNIELKDILMIPGVIELAPVNYINKNLENNFNSTLTKAIKVLKESREKEGITLSKDIKTRIYTLRQLIDDIEPIAYNIPNECKNRIIKRLTDLDLDIQADDDRVLKEVVIYSDKSDVSEEITRLRSHLKEFLTYLNKKNTPIGRSLDFIIQEILREITTLGNKAAHKDISPNIIKFKTELERIREQVQNIE